MSDQVQKIANTILTHLKQTKQINHLPEIVAALKSSSEYKKSLHQVVVSSATALDAVSLKSLTSYIEKRLSGAYELEQVIDPGLLAGFTLQIDDTFIDASVLGKMNYVQNKLTTKD